MNQELQLQIMDQEELGKQSNSIEQTNHTKTSQKKVYKRWLIIALYSLFLLSGQSISVLLGRQYYDKGGKSKWLGTLVQLVGFPILIPFYIIGSRKNTKNPNPNHDQPPSLLKLMLVYVSIGLLVAADCYLYSVGLIYLPVSTYSLICASQLAFNAFFSFFLNSQKFTPYIINSLVLLTISSTLLVFQTNTDQGSVDDKIPRGKYVVGFICTIAASAGYGLILSLTQFAFKRVLKIRESFKGLMDMIVYQSIVASGVILVGLFASGEWKGLKREMDGYQLGKVSYVMNLIWTAVFWQVFAVGSVGLILDVSSLFSNAIGVLGLPIVPVLAVVFFHDKMTGIKVIAMILATWGFVSYAYQHYGDDFKAKVGKTNNTGDGVSHTSSSSDAATINE